MWYIYLAIKKKSKHALCNNMDGPGDDHTKWSQPDRERQRFYDIAYIWNLKKNDTNECVYKTEIDSQM